MFNRIFGFFLVFATVVCGPVVGVYAGCQCDDGECGDNEYCDCQYGWGSDEPSCSCHACPANYVLNAACDGCMVPPPPSCSGYDDVCPSFFSDVFKCRELSVGCPSGCHTYERCNTTTGEISRYTDGSCHMEGNTCYANIRACGEFAFTGGFCLDQSTKTGVANWISSGKWDVSDCECNIENYDMEYLPFIFNTNIYVGCQSLYAYNSVATADKFIPDVNSQIKYTTTRYYCAKCYPGHIPNIVSSPANDGGVTRPADAPGYTWGTTSCDPEVQAPKYADGCVIDFTKETGELAVNDPACSRPCQLGFATTEDGATSANDCEIDTSVVFHDATGEFTVGEMTCPSNGG